MSYGLGLAGSPARQQTFTLLEKYSKDKKLGEGTYSEVYQGTCRKTRRKVAIKMILADVEDGTPNLVMREISIMKALQHPNVLALLECQTIETGTMLVLDYCPGDLKLFMDKCRADGRPLGRSPDKVRTFAKELLQGMVYVHAGGFLHRDLKPSNLLIDQKGTLKIADFGLARQVGFLPAAENLSAQVVTLWYRAPELLEMHLTRRPYDSAIDIWSCGCIFAEMVTDEPLFMGAGDEEGRLLQGIKVMRDNGVATFVERYLRYPTQRWDPNALSLLNWMLRYDPKKRATASTALTNPYFHPPPPKNAPPTATNPAPLPSLPPLPAFFAPQPRHGGPGVRAQQHPQPAPYQGRPDGRAQPQAYATVQSMRLPRQPQVRGATRGAGG